MPYLGLQSVRHGNSAVCIADIMTLHFPDAPLVADITYGAGRFWTWEHGRSIIGLDCVPARGADIQADYRHVPLRNQSVDLCVYDPPFIFTPGIRNWIALRTGDPGVRPKGPADLRSHTQQATLEARRVARQGMILKGMDPIANGPYWWLAETMQDVQTGPLRLTPTDLLIQTNPGNPKLNDPRWKNQYHFRRAHVYYLIYTWEGAADD